MFENPQYVCLNKEGKKPLHIFNLFTTFLLSIETKM